MRIDSIESVVLAFLAVWARVAGIFTFLPIPGLKSPVDSARLLLGLVVTIGLLPHWPVATVSNTPVESLAGLILREAAFGLCCGLTLHCLFETFQFGAQVLSQQAGFSYASMIDPTNETDSGVLLILCQLLCGWLAIGAGLDRHLIGLLTASLERVPPASFLATWRDMAALQKLSAGIFETGLLLALPAVAIFLVLDILLAVLSRIEQQLQLTSILFPVKTAGAVFAASLVVATFPRVFAALLDESFAVLRQTAAGR